MRDRVTRRPMPVEQSILWKPLNDAHYVVASLQPGDGGRLKIFVRQQALARAQSLARAAHGRRAFGLLIGHVYQCDDTGAYYLVIESVGEQLALTDEELSVGIDRALAEPLEGRGTRVLGWYRSVPQVEARPSGVTAATHASRFTEPWQTVLVLSETANGPGGAFFLSDTVNSRWFYAPFHELPDHVSAAGGPKSTCVDWPQYITAEQVVYDGREARDTAEVQRAKVRERRWWRPSEERSSSVDVGVHAVPEPEEGDSRWSPLTSGLGKPADDATSTEYDAPSKLADKTVRREAEEGLADVRPKPAKPTDETSDRRSGGFLDRPVRKVATVDDIDQRRDSRGAIRLVSDDDDTTGGDPPRRYIDLARAEGFFVAAKFDTPEDAGQAEALWVLNEPFSGLLLVVATTADEVVDASLHYNLHTDDAGLHRVPFPQHRDPDSRTIYVRETCVDSLRAKCQRLRATNNLVREWKVSPTITFMTPGEWESIGSSREDGAAKTVRTVNNGRIGELPEGVRSQFGLTVADDRPA